jgi:hypothetical protein
MDDPAFSACFQTDEALLSAAHRLAETHGAQYDHLVITWSKHAGVYHLKLDAVDRKADGAPTVPRNLRDSVELGSMAYSPQDEEAALDALRTHAQLVYFKLRHAFPGLQRDMAHRPLHI